MNSPRLASVCRPWKRVPRCASGCAAKGVDEKLGGIDRFTSVADAVEAFQEQTMT